MTLAAAHAAHTIMGDKSVRALGNALHRVGFPLWTPALPKPYYPGHLNKQSREPQARKLVYFPRASTALWGASDEDHKTEPLADVFVRLCKKPDTKSYFPKTWAIFVAA